MVDDLDRMVNSISLLTEPHMPSVKHYLEQRLDALKVFRINGIGLNAALKMILNMGETMPVEYFLLKDEPEHYLRCPRCGAEPFKSFLRGCVQKQGASRLFAKLVAKLRKREVRYCAVICDSCKYIVGHEGIKEPVEDAGCVSVGVYR
jgi:hypothetical protein